MTRFFKGPINSSKNIKAMFYVIDNLFNKKVPIDRQNLNENNIYGGQFLLPFQGTEIEPQCVKVDCAGCECTPTPTPTQTQTPTPTPTPPVPTPTPSSSYSFGPLSFTLNKSVP